MTEEIETKTEQNPEQTPGTKEYNFAQLRKQKSELELQQQEMRQTISHLQGELQQLKNQNAVPKSATPQNIYQKYGIAPGELLEADKFAAALEQERQEMREESRKYARETYQEIEKERYGEKLRAKYSDFDEVINPANAEKLAQTDPEMYESLSDMQDNYKKLDLAYKRIKKILQAEKAQVEEKVPAQKLVENTHKASYAYSPAGGTGVAKDIGDLRAFVNDPEAKRKAYEKLKSAQRRALR